MKIGIGVWEHPSEGGDIEPLNFDEYSLPPYPEWEHLPHHHWEWSPYPCLMSERVNSALPKKAVVASP